MPLPPPRPGRPQPDQGSSASGFRVPSRGNVEIYPEPLREMGGLMSRRGMATLVSILCAAACAAAPAAASAAHHRLGRPHGAGGAGGAVTPVAAGSGGAVASMDVGASKAGIDVLKRG